MRFTRIVRLGVVEETVRNVNATVRDIAETDAAPPEVVCADFFAKPNAHLPLVQPLRLREFDASGHIALYSDTTSRWRVEALGRRPFQHPLRPGESQRNHPSCLAAPASLVGVLVR